MTTVESHVNSDLLSWLQYNNFKYRLADIKTDKGALNILYNGKFSLKIYDRFGHGFGVTINVAETYDESIYDNDNFSLYWAFEYLKIKPTASFKDRTETQYLKNLPNLINDIKNIIPRLNQMSSLEWNSMKEWIRKEAIKKL